MSRTEYTVEWDSSLAMLARIENDPQAFRVGRRNNDIVNWFLIMLLCHPGRNKRFYRDRFKDLLSRLTADQRHDLDTWEDQPYGKIEDLWHYYGRLSEPSAIMNYWIPVGYAPLDQDASGPASN